MDKLYESLHLKSIKDLIEDNESLVNETNCEFECLICLEKKQQNDGLFLNECSHVFCKDCLKTYITSNADGYISCPFKNEIMECKLQIKNFELKYLLNDEEYMILKKKCLAQIEAQLGKTFHCKNSDCIGFCPLEENMKTFSCPICEKINCIECDAIHYNITCDMYKEELKKQAIKAEKERKEKEDIDLLIKAGAIMRCPRCNILLEKRDGQCQYIRCFYCKMDICWLTKGPRWGPGGKGDTSGGCKCGVNGIRCHPDCTNCH